VCIVGANGRTFMCIYVFLSGLFQIFYPLKKMLMLCEYTLLVAMAPCCLVLVVCLKKLRIYCEDVTVLYNMNEDTSLSRLVY
jgi:hypothetical protein